LPNGGGTHNNDNNIFAPDIQLQQPAPQQPRRDSAIAERRNFRVSAITIPERQNRASQANDNNGNNR
ncbi:hypothetical protein ACI65C_000095, partial [Semiaphis heraclei]